MGTYITTSNPLFPIYTLTPTNTLYTPSRISSGNRCTGAWRHHGSQADVLQGGTQQVPILKDLENQMENKLENATETGDTVV